MVKLEPIDLYKWAAVAHLEVDNNIITMPYVVQVKKWIYQ